MGIVNETFLSYLVAFACCLHQFHIQFVISVDLQKENNTDIVFEKFLVLTVLLVF